MRLKLCAHVVFVIAVLASVQSRFVSAAVIPGITSLQDLINRGPLVGNGVQVGNDVFYNFTYSGSPTPNTVGAPNPTAIFVTSTDSGPGLRFAFPWTSTLGNNQNSLITYSVHVVDIGPIAPQFINNAILDFQSSVAATSLADNANTTLTLGDNNGHVPFSEQTVLNTGTSPSTPISNSQAVSPALRDFGVSDGITVHTAPDSTGSATITFVDNIFGQSAVPEPGLLSLFGIAALGLLARRRSTRIV
ncbi:MAG TPA: PEP-CTERM sorting domain-containing protein [Tepidisphaeraceae bacterium]|jgi:hypothetical protein